MFRAARTLLQSLIRVYEGGLYTLYKKEEEERPLAQKRSFTLTPYHCRNCKRVVSIRDLTQTDGTHLATMSIVYNAEIRNGESMECSQRGTTLKRCRSCTRIPTPFCPKRLRQCVSTNNLSNRLTNGSYAKTTEELQTSMTQLNDRSTSTTTLEKHTIKNEIIKETTTTESKTILDSGREGKKEVKSAHDESLNKDTNTSQSTGKAAAQISSYTTTSGDDHLLGKKEKRTTETSTDDIQKDSTTSKSCETESIVEKIDKSRRKSSLSKPHKGSNRPPGKSHKRSSSRKRSTKSDEDDEADESPSRSKLRSSTSRNDVRKRHKRKRKQMRDSNEAKVKRRKPQLCDAGTNIPQLVDGSTSTSSLAHDKVNSSAQNSTAQNVNHQNTQSNQVYLRPSGPSRYAYDVDLGRYKKSYRNYCTDEPSTSFCSRTPSRTNISGLPTDMNIVPSPVIEDNNSDVVFLRHIRPEPNNIEAPQIINIHENQDYTHSDQGFPFQSTSSTSYPSHQMSNLWFPTTYQTVPNLAEHPPLTNWGPYTPVSTTPNFTLNPSPDLFLSSNPYAPITFPIFPAPPTIPPDLVSQSSGRGPLSTSRSSHSRHRSTSRYRILSDEESSYTDSPRARHRRVREERRGKRRSVSRDRSRSRDERSYRDRSRSRTRVPQSHSKSRQRSRLRCHERSATPETLEYPMPMMENGYAEQVHDNQLIPASIMNHGSNDCQQLILNSSCVDDMQFQPEEWQFNCLFWEEVEESCTPTIHDN